jgi:hypothetical protein
MSDRQRLYGASFIEAGPQDVLTVNDLSDGVAQEILARASLEQFGEADPSACLEEERAGLPREVECPGGIENPPFPGFCPRVCAVKTESLDRPARTAAYVPRLAAGEYALFETEQVCSFNPDVNNSQVCRPVAPPTCKGNAGPAPSNICLVVPAVRPGESVFLYGYNYFDTAASVVLVPSGSVQAPRELEARVCGNDGVPADAPVDCGVNDILSFQIPEDLTPGVYRIAVSVPNNLGIPDFERPEYESSLQFPDAYIEVVPPASAQFQLATGEFHCIDDTDGEWGRDEIGIVTVTYGITAEDGFKAFDPLKFEFGGVERGDRRVMLTKDTMSRVLFSGTAPAGFGVTIVGHEIDNREAYKQQTTEFAEAFVLIIDGAYGKLTGALGTTVGTLVGLAGVKAATATAIGAAVAVALNVGFALWAPADLVIEDSINTSFLGLAELTSLNYPSPDRAETTSANDILVIAEPCEDSEEDDRPECEASSKSTGSYRERREYQAETECPDGLPPGGIPGGVCDPERKGSRYQITLDYTRTE